MKGWIQSEQAYRQNVERLTVAHSALKMSVAELGILYAEKAVDLRIAVNLQRDNPSELASLRKKQTEAAVKDIGDFIRETIRSKDRERERLWT